ncbi:MAG: hypothetical protein Q9202_005925 [Teloschistes flavicans]
METIRGLNSNGPAIIGTGVAFTALAVISLGLRFGSKRIAHSGFGADDGLLLLALLLYFVAEILVIRSDVLGRQASSPEDHFYTAYLEYVYIYSVFYFPIIASAQISVLLFYRHIFFPSSFRWTSTVLIAVVCAWLVTALVIEIGYPSYPISHYFPGGPETTFHVNYLKFWLVMAIIEVLLETIILVLPIRQLYLLQLSMEKKLLCSLIFAMGGFVIITGIIRTIKVYQPSGHDVDLTQGDIWLNVHLGTALICACLPTYRPLVSRTSSIMKGFSGRRSRSNQSNQHTSDSDHPYKLRPVPNNAGHGDSIDFMAAVYVGPHQHDMQGNFVEARRSDSTNATKAEGSDESPVRTGEAIRIKQSVDVV